MAQAIEYEPIKIVKGALAELEDGTIVLRGVIDQESLRHIRADNYQREQMRRDDIMAGLKNGSQLPDVELGMRGQNFTSKGSTFVLNDPLYAIDGWQRISTALKYIDAVADAHVNIGAMIRLDTTEEYERARFAILNGKQRVKVSASLLLRNQRHTSPAVLMLFGVSGSDRAFVLNGRVAWGQNMARNELLSAFTFAKIVSTLHSHKVGGLSSQMEQIVSALDRGVDAFGIQVMRENVKVFFDLVDECWGIRRIHYRDGAAYMKGGFLAVLARLISDHHDFWKQPEERRLFIEAPLRRKLAQFPITDPTVVNLAGGSGKSREMLYMLLRDHLNRGKTTKRLVSRKAGMITFNDEEEAEAA